MVNAIDRLHPSPTQISLVQGSKTEPVPETTTTFLDESQQVEKKCKGAKWNERAVSYINKWEKQLDEKMPNNLLQVKLHTLEKHINKLLKTPIGHVKAFNAWIDDNGHGAWYKKLCIFAGKLPIRAVRNIVRVVYNIIKALIYSFVHPLKALSNTAKYIVNFIDQLTKPETYTKMGAGILGASLGQMAVTAGFGPYAYIGLALGGGLMLIGLTAGAIKAAIKGEKSHKMQAIKEELWNHIKSIPESLMTGFVMGVIIGGIQQCVASQQITNPDVKNVTDLQAAKNWLYNDYLPKHHLPPPTNITLDPGTGQIVATWKGSQLDQLLGSRAADLQVNVQHVKDMVSYKIILNKNNTMINAFATGRINPDYLPTYNWNSTTFLPSDYPGLVISKGVSHAADPAINAGISLHVGTSGTKA